MAVNIFDALTIILYYIAVVTVGVWAGRKVRPYIADDTHFRCAFEAARLAASARIRGPVQWHHKHVVHTAADHKEADDNEYLLRLFLANRNVSLTLGFISMTATWVGGGYLNGTAEAVFNYGIVWCQAPLGYALSLIIGGWFFAGKMHVTKALTMLDPFQQHYGPWIAILLCVPAICGELFWTAAILAALGDTVAVTMNIDSTFFIVVSSFVILFYTSLGGLYSVIYTDLFQMVGVVIGLWTSLASFLTNEAVGMIGAPHNDWVGTIHSRDVSQSLDQLFMTVLGGIPWQASDMEVCIVLRSMVCLIGAVATTMALNVTSVFDLWTLSSDIVYVLLFPQFVAYFFLRNLSNAYGAVLDLAQ
ncbi:hypothetical protein V5799_010925 [Amblyomma americanum]|uniref:Uncharacterized protein n=1 Tax=Amblyomma americanum TaxID=6943 RepID=A0AAQ4EIJ4_AMBAM